MLNEWLKQVAVLGAAGKMGRGIALLLLQEMARVEAETLGTVGSGEYQLTLVDTDEKQLNAIWRYLQPQLVKYATQDINALRRYFSKRSDLVENREMIQAFVEGCLLLLRRSNQVSAVKGSRLVFEAVAEDFSLKKSVYQTISSILEPSTIYLTNTSSIPIEFLDEQSGLNHRLIGFHFYNPPPLQKLLELIPSAQGAPEVKEIAQELGKRLGKKLITSADVAGFIGNGHFMRELCYACERVEALSPTHGQEGAIHLLNSVTQKLLLRPMGIFQLADYVGIDVCQKILGIMSCHIRGETFHCSLVDEMVSRRALGGQDGKGSQKPGFFAYADGKISGIYNRGEQSYQPLDTIPLPPQAETWARLIKDPNRASKLKAHFDSLWKDQGIEAKEAQAYLLRSRQIAEQLVSSGVATSIEDVNTVLEMGFSHLYGAVNDYVLVKA